MKDNLKMVIFRVKAKSNTEMEMFIPEVLLMERGKVEVCSN